MLAPSLFAIFINDLIGNIILVGTHPPSLQIAIW